jgi:ADP-heptose:LPS heptosyltransferase
VIERETILQASFSPGRIAVFRALQLGDLLVAVPAFRALRTRFPHAEITLIGLPWARSFVERFYRYLDRFVEFAGYPGICEVPSNPASTERFIREQRAERYDLVVQMHGSGRVSTPFALALGGAVTAGYHEGPRPTGLTIGAEYRDRESEILRNLRLIRLLGCPDTGTHLEFPLFSRDREEADSLLAGLAGGSRPWIGIHVGARPSARRWMPERFAHVADALARRHGAQIVLTGSPDEREIVRQVAALMETAPLDLTGKTSLGGLAALINRLDLFISNDTGPAHLAVAVDTPSVIVAGPADPERWAPLDPAVHPLVRRPVECSPCTFDVCPIDHRCLRLISEAMVLETAEPLLEGAMACNV